MGFKLFEAQQLKIPQVPLHPTQREALRLLASPDFSPGHLTLLTRENGSVKLVRCLWRGSLVGMKIPIRNKVDAHGHRAILHFHRNGALMLV